jgi:microcystin-dependent protein
VGSESFFGPNLLGQDPWARRGESDARVAASVIPVGVINAYYGTSSPSGWLICDGSTFSSAAYPALAALLGGTTLPNLKGRVIVGIDAAQSEFDVLGETGGSKTATAPHTHDLNGHTHQHDHGHNITDPTHTHGHDHGLTNHNHGGGTGVHAHTVNNGVRGSSTSHAHDHDVAEFAMSPTGGVVTFTANGPGTSNAGVANSTQGSSDATSASSGITATATTSTPANTLGPSVANTLGSSAAATSGNLQPYMAINYIIKAA